MLEWSFNFLACTSMIGMINWVFHQCNFLPKILDLNVRLVQYSDSNCLIKLIIFLDFDYWVFFGNCQFSWVVYFIGEISPGSLGVFLLCVVISYWYFWELFLFFLFLLQYFFELDFFHYCFHKGIVAKLCL